MSSSNILQLFKDSGALLTGHFLLTSGRHSDVYYEKFTLLKNPTICTQICKSMADHFKNSGVQTVVGPTTGGILIAYDVARYLGVESIYAEQGENGRVFKRGFSLEPGEKVLIVDDVLTTGKSVEEVIALVKSYKADIVGTSRESQARLEAAHERLSDKEAVIADIKEDRDRWRQQATALLTDKRPAKSLLARLLGR